MSSSSAVDRVRPRRTLSSPLNSTRQMKSLMRIASVWLFLATCGVADDEAQNRGFTVAVAGQPKAVLVLSDNPENPQVIKYAAEEFQRVIHKATGAKLAAIQESELNRQANQNQGIIFLGPCEAAKQAGVEARKLPANAYLIKSDHRRLFLYGKDGGTDHPRNYHVDMGTLFAVYEFLERQVGIRWLWPGDLGEFVPRRHRVVSGVWKTKSLPRLMQRYWRFEAALHYGREAWSTETNVYNYKVDVYKWLRRHRFMRRHNLDYAEAFRDYWERFGDTRPELFNLLPDGSRRPDGGRPHHVSMCVSEPHLWKQVVADWRAKRTAKLPWVNCKPNDTPGKCLCERCLSWDVRPASEAAARKAFAAGDRDGWSWPQHLGSLSDRYARYLLAVQKEAERFDKNATVISYAYANYSRPPAATNLNDRVVIALASSLFFPYTEETSREFRSDWDGWSATGARLVFRPNITLGSHNMPVHYARRVGADIQHAFQHGVVATDLDSLTGMWATQGPSLYVVARTHLPVDKTVEEILDEYYEAFGPAKESVRRYFDYWESVTEPITRKHWEEIENRYRLQDPDGLNFRTFYKAAHEIYTTPVMSEGRRLLRVATERSTGDETASKRVEFLTKGLREAQLTLDAQKAFREFQETGDRAEFDVARTRLQQFRRSIERDYVVNLSYVTFQENLTWRDLD